MAYFPNSSAGEGFDEECSNCVYGGDACPVWLVQFTYNYEACNNPVASKILNDLVKDDGTCLMKEFIENTVKDAKGQTFIERK